MTLKYMDELSDLDDVNWTEFRRQIESQLEVVFVDVIPKEDCTSWSEHEAINRREERARTRSQRNRAGGRRRRKHGGRR